MSGEDQGPDDGTVSGEDQGPDPDTVTEDGTEDDEHAVGEEGEHQAPDEEEDGNPEKPHPDESDKSVADALANTAHRLCPMLRPLAGKRAQTVRSLITWIAFVMWRWHIENNVSQSALVPLLQLIVQVISVAGATKLTQTLSLKSFPTPYLNYESGLVWMTQVISKRWFAATNATESIPMMAACATDLMIVTENY